MTDSGQPHRTGGLCLRRRSVSRKRRLPARFLVVLSASVALLACNGVEGGDDVCEVSSSEGLSDAVRRANAAPEDCVFLKIWDSPLTSLHGIQGYAKGTVSLRRNAALVDLSALGSETSLRGTISIQHSASLVDARIGVVGGSVGLTRNVQLETLSLGFLRDEGYDPFDLVFGADQPLFASAELTGRCDEPSACAVHVTLTDPGDGSHGAPASLRIENGHLYALTLQNPKFDELTALTGWPMPDLLVVKATSNTVNRDRLRAETAEFVEGLRARGFAGQSRFCMTRNLRALECTS